MLAQWSKMAHANWSFLAYQPSWPQDSDQGSADRNRNHMVSGPKCSSPLIPDGTVGNGPWLTLRTHRTTEGEIDLNHEIIWNKRISDIFEDKPKLSDFLSDIRAPRTVLDKHRPIILLFNYSQYLIGCSQRTNRNIDRKWTSSK